MLHNDYAKNRFDSNSYRTQPITGERYLPWMPLTEWGAIHYDHLGRYLFVEQIASGKVILDIASGEGYGASLLAQVAQKVVGIDIDAATVEFAKNKYLQDNLEFIQGNACEIPLDGEEVFDIISSFETLEHVDENEQVLVINEFSRLLKPNGLLVISTPNYEYTHNVITHDNPYHKKEVTLEEFDQLLASKFPYRLLFGQRSYFQNQIIPLDSDEGIYREIALTVGGESLIRTSINHKISQNYICVASKSNIPAKLAATFTTDVDDSIITDLQTQRATLIKQCHALGQELQKQAAAFIGQIKDQRQAYENSTSWKLTMPIRAVAKRLKKT